MPGTVLRTLHALALYSSQHPSEAASVMALQMQKPSRGEVTTRQRLSQRQVNAGVHILEECAMYLHVHVSVDTHVCVLVQ